MQMGLARVGLADTTLRMWYQLIYGKRKALMYVNIQYQECFNVLQSSVPEPRLSQRAPL